MTQTVLLGDICLQITDGTHSTVKDNENGNYYLLSAKNVKDRIIITDKERKIDRPTLESLRRRTKTARNDVLVTSVGTIGETAIIKDETPEYEFQRSVLILKPNVEIVHPQYLYYYMRSLKSSFISMATGAVQKCLFIGQMKNVSVDLPDIDTQKEIVDVLGTIDEKIELNRKMNEKLEQMGQALFRHYFIDNPEVEEWKAGTVDHLFTLTMGLSPKGESYNNVGDGVLLLNGAADFTGASITPKRYTSSPTRISRSGDIIFCIRGTIGNVCIGYEEYCLGRGVAAMTPTEHAVSYVYFSTIRAIAEMELAASGSVIRGLSKDDIAKRKVNLPPEDILKTFEAKALPLIERVRVNSEEIQTLTTLRDTLLPRLISGKIKINGTD